MSRKPPLTLVWGTPPTEFNPEHLHWTTSDVFTITESPHQKIVITLERLDVPMGKDLIIALSSSSMNWGVRTHHYSDAISFTIRRLRDKKPNDWTAAIRTKMYGTFAAFSERNFWAKQQSSSILAVLTLNTEHRTAHMKLMDSETKVDLCPELSTPPSALTTFLYACDKKAINIGFHCGKMSPTEKSGLCLQVHRYELHWPRRKTFYLCARLFREGRATLRLELDTSLERIVSSLLMSELPFDALNE
eukprot:PhF_6_TR12301/c0_g1_i1/m.19537